MKIKTITCHDVYNAGASLQAYALTAYLTSLGHDVQIIDYKPDYLSRHHSLTIIGNPKYDRPLVREAYLLAKLPGRLRAKYGLRKRRYDAFREKYLPLTRRYNSFNELKADPPEADVYLAGSDQIWNTLFQNGKDPAFYLTFAPEERVRASYAASFATESVEEAWQEQVRNWLSQLDRISVRERSSVDILRQMGLDGQAVLDPVFLLSREEWEKLAAPVQAAQPYVLVYDFDRNPRIAETAQKLAVQNGWQIRTLQELGYGDSCEKDAGPLEFLGLIRNAACVLSNSFHATAFSLVFGRPFRVFDRSEAINTRMRDLMHLVGVEDLREIVWEDMGSRLEKAVVESKEYLFEILEKAMSIE